MDPELMKEFKKFKKKSIANPVVESSKKRQHNEDSSTSSKAAPKRGKKALPPQLLQQSKKQASTIFNYKTASFRRKNKFSILASIVDIMKSRYQGKKFDSLSLEEILDATHNTDISEKDKEWLSKEALRNNSKLTFQDGRYSFKPMYPLQSRKSLVKVLEKHATNGLGGILLDDIRESLPEADDIVRSISDKVLFVTRPADKKAILFYHDAQFSLHVDEEFQKHWRSVAVEGIGEADVEKYLDKVGLTAMQGIPSGSPNPQLRRKKTNKNKRQFKVLNTHLGGGVLKDYFAEGGKK